MHHLPQILMCLVALLAVLACAMMHMESVGFSATAPGAGGAAAAAFAGDSLVVKNAAIGSKILLLGCVNDNQAAGFCQLVWPSGHDTTRNIRIAVAASEVYNRLPMGVAQILEPQETIAATIGGSAVAGDVESGVLHIFYENAPGINGHFIGWDELQAKAIREVTVQDSIVSVAGPGWGGARLITAATDLLHANTDYAILGANISLECVALGIRSPDFGNVRVSVPGHDANALMTANWFGDMAYEFGLPLIPVINSGNKGNILIDVAQDENAGTVPFSLCLVELTQ